VRRRHHFLIGAIAGLAALFAGSAAAVAASSDALPGGPGYALRSVGEHVRLLFAGNSEQERLRLAFSERRIQQARQALAGGDRTDATTLLRDSSVYLQEAHSGVDELGQSQRSDFEHQVRSVQASEQQAESQLRQPRDQEQQGSSSAESSPSPYGPGESGQGHTSEPGASGDTLGGHAEG
jgi:hypothetical protein